MKNILRTTGKVLSLRFSKSDLDFSWSTLIFGLLCTWLVGIGRYWDHPDPHLLQRLGVGSLIYVVALSLVLWILLLPLRLTDLSYRHLLTLITLTSPPAILYATPVERFLPLETAQSVNAWFLGIVALWRVSIYLRYLLVHLKAPPGTAFVAGFLPLCGIVFALTVLNLEKAVFEIMAGMEPTPGTSNDAAYASLFMLSFLSLYAAPVLLICYFATIGIRWRLPTEGSTKADSPSLSEKRENLLNPEASVIVTFDEYEIRCEKPGGQSECIQWNDLDAVLIETTDGGPLAPDVFWLLLSKDLKSGCIYPQGATGDRALFEELQSRLPGMNHDLVTAAMTTTDNQKFLVWTREN